MDILESISRIALAFVLGGLIGWERENTNRPAGFRTHIIVATSACLAMLVNYEIFYELVGKTNMDPGRMGSYVISGIGFLGAGTIIREGASVKGLTTAASLWASAMLGLACGAGLYEISVLVTMLVIFTLLVMNKIEHKVTKKRRKKKNKNKQVTQPAVENNEALYAELLKQLLSEETVEITIKKSDDEYVLRKKA